MSAPGPRAQIVLFDLDGTLSDSAPGILASLRAAFADNGIAWVDDATARTLLGPPFWHSLPPLVGAENLDAVVDSYRKHYVDDRALFNTRRYDGIDTVLAALAARPTGAGQPRRLAVATSKPEPHAREIIDFLGVGSFFETVGGDTLDGELDSKALVVGEVLRRLGDPDPATVLMIGDRSHDVLGSAAHGVGCVGALWGYGSRVELVEAGARHLCANPVDLLGLTELALP